MLLIKKFGNLTVSGTTTTLTLLHSVADNQVILNDVTGAPSEDGGVAVNQ